MNPALYHHCYITEFSFSAAKFLIYLEHFLANFCSLLSVYEYETYGTTSIYSCLTRQFTNIFMIKYIVAELCLE